MSQFDNKKAAALKYEGKNKAPIIVASGSGYVADKIIKVAQENKVPIYQDNSLVTLLSQLQAGNEVPHELFQTIVDIYIYFLNYNFEEEKEEQQFEDISSKTQDFESQQEELSKDLESVDKSKQNTPTNKGKHINISISD